MQVQEREWRRDYEAQISFQLRQARAQWEAEQAGDTQVLYNEIDKLQQQLDTAVELRKNEHRTVTSLTNIRDKYKKLGTPEVIAQQQLELKKLEQYRDLYSSLLKELDQEVAAKLDEGLRAGLRAADEVHKCP